MAIDQLTCSNCGAALDVPDGAVRFRCTYCQRPLRVRQPERSGDQVVLEPAPAQSSAFALLALVIVIAGVGFGSYRCFAEPTPKLHIRAVTASVVRGGCRRL